MKYYRINLDTPVQNHERFIRNTVSNYKDRPLIINFINTKGLTPDQIKWIDYNFPGLQIRIAGGYSDAKIAKDNRDYLKYDNIYTPEEMLKILREIDKIESGIGNNWNPEQKLFYFIGYLKNKIIYHPDFEKQPSKDIRSLTGLFSHKTVCAGYALILKELCDRNGISCDYVTGFTHKDDKGNLTGPHAWNLVHLNGRTVPIDLTWTAGRNFMGQFLDISDIGNVNQFIKSHIPGSDEPIQDYSNKLKSLEGNYVRGVYGLVNKTMVYDTTQLMLKRSDNTRFTVSLVSQTIDQGKSIYSYVYNGVSSKGVYTNPMIIKSTTNIFKIHYMVVQRRKMFEKINTLRSKQRTSEEQKEYVKLVEQYKKTYYYEEFEHYITDMLFSKANIAAAIKRNDFYIGGIEATKDDKDKITGISGVVVDPQLGKELKPLKQKVCVRSDGSSFVLQEISKFHLAGRPNVFRYKMYENIPGDDGRLVVKKNTIMTDNDIFLDNRQSLYDDFLARDRVDRKERETSGYLGYYSKEGVRTYVPEENNYFSKGIYKDYTINDSSFRNHYADLTFADVKRFAETFTFDGVDVTNRRTGAIIKDKSIVIQAKFAYVWLHSASSKYTTRDGDIPGLEYAFNSGSERIFNYVCGKIQDSINKYGYIDSVDILAHVTDDDENQYKYEEEIIAKLFATPMSAGIVNDLFRLQNPGAMKENKPIVTFGLGFSGISNAIFKISERTTEEGERKKQMIDVVYENGTASLRGR